MNGGRPAAATALVALAGLALCGPGTSGALPESPSGYTATVPGSSVTFEMAPVPAEADAKGFWIGRPRRSTNAWVEV